jgi:hypothetical protein
MHGCERIIIEGDRLTRQRIIIIRNSQAVGRELRVEV